MPLILSLSIRARERASRLTANCPPISSIWFGNCRDQAQNPSFWTKKSEIHHEYKKVQGFWLPIRNESVSYIRLGGRTTLTIEYKDYRVTDARQALPVLSSGDRQPVILKKVPAPAGRSRPHPQPWAGLAKLAGVNPRSPEFLGRNGVL
jgi:hypothetical protein